MSFKSGSSNEMLQSDDAFVLVRPDIVDGVWNGSVTVSLAGIFEEEDSQLTKAQRGQLMSIAALLASALPVMDQDDYVYDQLSGYLEENMPDLLDDIIFEEDEQVVTATSKDGKVVRLSFNTKTEGNA